MVNEILIVNQVPSLPADVGFTSILPHPPPYYEILSLRSGIVTIDLIGWFTGDGHRYRLRHQLYHLVLAVGAGSRRP